MRNSKSPVMNKCGLSVRMVEGEGGIFLSGWFGSTQGEECMTEIKF